MTAHGLPQDYGGITAGLKVLDLGCGDGTTVLPAARLGADVAASTSPAILSKPETGARR
jgi:2-polyprenyl-3-methyl-5-hydroxy-6-metoxy-1,4-benzoquinol methylase